MCSRVKPYADAVSQNVNLQAPVAWCRSRVQLNCKRGKLKRSTLPVVYLDVTACVNGMRFKEELNDVWCIHVGHCRV